MKIKRQEAFDIAVNAIKALPPSERNNAAIEYLESARSERYIKWDKDKILDAMNTWKNEHGRNPTIKDLRDPMLPSAGTIINIFNITASEFFRTYFPSPPSRHLHKYSNRTADEWVADFIIQYETILPSSAKDYDLHRRSDSPAWVSIAGYAGVSTWNELISFTGVNSHCLKRKYRLKSEVKEWTVRSSSHFLEEYLKLKEDIEGIMCTE